MNRRRGAGLLALQSRRKGKFSRIDRVYVNSSLHTFVSSYSLFLSSIFLLKAKFYEIEQDEVEEIAAHLKDQVLALEKPLEQEVPFWGAHGLFDRRRWNRSKR